MSIPVLVISREEPKSMPEGYTLGKWIPSDLAVVNGVLTNGSLSQINSAKTDGLKVMFYLKDRKTHEAVYVAYADFQINFSFYVFTHGYTWLENDINTVVEVVRKR